MSSFGQNRAARAAAPEPKGQGGALPGNSQNRGERRQVQHQEVTLIGCINQNLTSQCVVFKLSLRILTIIICLTKADTSASGPHNTKTGI